jgi:hypothetical protein
MVKAGTIAEVREVDEDERSHEKKGRKTPFVILKRLLKQNEGRSAKACPEKMTVPSAFHPRMGPCQQAPSLRECRSRIG